MQKNLNIKVELINCKEYIKNDERFENSRQWFPKAI